MNKQSIKPTELFTEKQMTRLVSNCERANLFDGGDPEQFVVSAFCGGEFCTEVTDEMRDYAMTLMA